MDWWQQKGLSTGIRLQGQADDSEAGLVQLSHSGSSVLLGGRTRRAWSEWGR